MAYNPNNPNGQATMANSAPVVIASDQSALPIAGALAVNPAQNQAAIATRAVGETKLKSSFAQVLSGVDTSAFSLIQTGGGMTVSQTGGNLVVTTGTTANSETIIRSTTTYIDNVIMKWSVILSQRIASNNFFYELVDIIGDALPFTMNSATSITVTIATANPFTAASVGQSVYLGAIAGIATAIPGRYAISAVSGTAVTFTVAGFTASGSGTLSLFGWNYHQTVYNGTTATITQYDTQGKGWNSGFTSVNPAITTASPGVMGIMQVEDGQAAYLEQLTASTATSQLSQKASRVINTPVYGTVLALQIRALNGSTAPATTTTMTTGMVSVENFVSQPVNITGSKAQSLDYPMPVQVASALPTGANSIGAVTVSSGTITTVTTVGSVTALAAINSVATTNGLSIGTQVTPTTPATLSIKGTAGRLHFLQVGNPNIGSVYVKVFNLAAPTLGTTAANMNFLIPANSSINVAINDTGLFFSTAIVVAVTNGPALTDNTAITTGCTLNYSFI